MQNEQGKTAPLASPPLLDPRRHALFLDLVPVILVDGTMHGYWRVEEDRLRRALAAAPGTPPWP